MIIDKKRDRTPTRGKINKAPIVIAFIIFCMLITGGIVSALDGLGTFKQNSVVNISQVCSDATYITISSITNPDTATIVSNINMTSTGSGGYSYTLVNTSTNRIGRYDVIGISDGCSKTFATYFEIKNVGMTTGYTSIIVVIVMLLLGFLIWKIVYRKNKFIGNIFFIVIGGAIMFMFAGQGEKIMMFMGIMVIGGGLFNMLFDLLK